MRPTRDNSMGTNNRERNLRGVSLDILARTYDHAIPVGYKGVERIANVIYLSEARREAAKTASATSAINNTVVYPQATEEAPASAAVELTAVASPVPESVESNQTAIEASEGQPDMAEIYRQIEAAHKEAA